MLHINDLGYFTIHQCRSHSDHRCTVNDQCSTSNDYDCSCMNQVYISVTYYTVIVRFYTKPLRLNHYRSTNADSNDDRRLLLYRPQLLLFASRFFFIDHYGFYVDQLDTSIDLLCYTCNDKGSFALFKKKKK
jgi:hypothetical protein